MKRIDRRPWIAGAGAAAVIAAGLAMATTPSAQAAAGCQVSYTVTSQWTGGFGANVSITNLGSPLSNWTLAWSFGTGQTITQLWNGSYTQSGGSVAVSNVSYNGSIPTGASTGFGFNGSWTGSNPVPTAFTLNGTTCTGSVSTGTPTPSSSSTPSASASASATGTPPPPKLPCDIYAAGGTPCIARAPSTRRRPITRPLLMMVTALSPIIGYDQASVISHCAIEHGLTL